MTFIVHRLDPSARASVAAHFLGLPLPDIGLRFGSGISSAAITAYVDRIDFGRHAVFGAYDNRRTLIGVGHLGIEENCGEIGLSVLPAFRRMGIAGALFRRAMLCASELRLRGLTMYFMSWNVPIVRIARRFGMAIRQRGGNAEAHLSLEGPVMAQQWASCTTQIVATG